MRAVSQNPSRDRDIRYEVTDGPAFFAEDQSGDLFLGKKVEKKIDANNYIHFSKNSRIFCCSFSSTCDLFLNVTSKSIWRRIHELRDALPRHCDCPAGRSHTHFNDGPGKLKTMINGIFYMKGKYKILTFFFIVGN